MIALLVVLVVAFVFMSVVLLRLGQRRVDAAYRLGRVHGATYGARQ